MNSNECRDRAAACTELADIAGDVVSKVSLHKASEAWNRMAAEMETNDSSGAKGDPGAQPPPAEL